MPSTELGLSSRLIRLKWLLSVRFRLVLFCLALFAVLVGANLLLRHFLTQRQAFDDRQIAEIERVQQLQQALQAVGKLRVAFLHAMPGSAVTRLQSRAVLMELHRQAQEAIELAGMPPSEIVPARFGLPEQSQIEALLAALAADEEVPLRDLSRRLDQSLESTMDALHRVLEPERSGLIEINAQETVNGHAALLWANAVTFVAMVISLALMGLILRQIVLPLQRTARALRELQSGAKEPWLPPVGTDEFGDMALALRQFAEHARQLDRRAFEDALTGLPNRAALERALDEVLPQQAEGSAVLALMFLGLDHFKSVNDSLGHPQGDRYLQAAAQRLLQLAPSGGVKLFRYTGDQFALLRTGVNEDSRGDAGLRMLAEHLRVGMSMPFTLDGQPLSMSVSIGVAQYPRDAAGVDELVSGADAAMFQAKRGGRNQVQFASRELRHSVRTRTLLAGEIGHGIEAGEFEPFFQPIIDVAAGRVMGAEALMRWRHPVRGLVMPGEFVPAAEESGAIGALGSVCLERTCAQLARFTAGGRDMRVAVNLSARQLYSGDLLKEVQNCLSRHQVRPDQLEFEITESVMMVQPERAALLLQELRSLGLTLCIDDFGTGYSSLSYVQRFPVHKIKIDRSFIVRIGQSRETEAIVTATVAMCRSLKLDIVAEGVETVAQMRRLRDLGLVQQQGFLFTPALPVPEFEYWLETAPKQAEEIALVA